MTSAPLKQILSELYEIDPDLRAHEQELIPILEKMLAHKPHAEPSEAFVQKLRTILRDKAHSPLPTSYSRFMPSFNYAITGAILGAIITGPLVYTFVQNGGQTMLPPSDGASETALFSYKVEEAGNQAFGDLSSLNVSGGYGRGGGAPAMDMARPESGGGGVDMYSTDQRMIIAPEMTEYRLKFEGEMPALTQQQVDVLKRQKGTSSADMATILRSVNTGLMDMGSFPNAKTDMISFYQDTAYGYIVTVSFRDGSVSLNANWEKWPHPESKCQDEGPALSDVEGCYRRFMLNINDVPADGDVIAIAEKFVKDHGIDLTNYGPAEVDNLWRRNYETAPNKAEFYVPDSIRVVYPQLAEGKPVYDEGGSKAGISIGVNIRENRVSDAWGLMDQKYLKSSYPAVTDASLITKYLETFGRMSRDWMPPETTVTSVDVTLGTPEMGFMKLYAYDNATSEELVVPALIFPVTNVPTGEYFYRDTIAVPLAVDLLEKMNQQPSPMPVEPIIMEDQPTTRTSEE